MEKRFFDGTPKKLPKYLDKTVIEGIIDTANHDNGKHGRRNHLLLMVLWQTGLRVSEIANLRKGDIKTDTLVVRGGKGGKDRVIPMKSDLRNILLVFTDQMKVDQIVFDMTDRQIRNVVYKYRPEGVELHPHTFRHSFAVHCLKCGMNVRSLQKILGHASLSVTQVYLDVVGDDVKKDFEKVNW